MKSAYVYHYHAIIMEGAKQISSDGILQADLRILSNEDYQRVKDSIYDTIGMAPYKREDLIITSLSYLYKIFLD